MLLAEKTAETANNSLILKAKAYMELMKARLSFLVAFSSGFGFMLANTNKLDWIGLTGLSIGAFLLSGGGIIINQIIEVDYDKMMKRTKTRPLPTGRVTKMEATVLASVSSLSGLVLLAVLTNTLTVILSLVSLVLYSFVYTPLKRVGPIAVVVGAIPGALPPLLGWVAATGSISYEAVVIFSIQFIWQFPHFWAIAWVADEDYTRAGFKLLPNGGKKDSYTATQLMIYALFLLPLGLLPMKIGITGINSAMIALVSGIVFVMLTIMLVKDRSRKSALKIMFGSFFYLPIVQIAFLLDKI